MYKLPNNIKVPAVVNELDEYMDSCCPLYDLENWYITKEIAEGFKVYISRLESLANEGNPWAQYRLGNLYFTGVTYASREAYEAAYESDAIIGTNWLIEAAKQGFVAAVDNLVGMGVGEEANRLRAISREVIANEQGHIVPWESDQRIPVVQPSLYERVWEIAYGNGS